MISRSVFDLEAVLKALVGSAVQLTGAFSGAICIRDGETFRYRAGAGPGYSEKLQRYLESTPVFPGRGSIPGRVLLSGKIEEIPDVLEDSEYKIRWPRSAYQPGRCSACPCLANKASRDPSPSCAATLAGLRRASSNWYRPSPTRP